MTNLAPRLTPMPAKEHFVTQVVRNGSEVEADECGWRESLTKRTSAREGAWGARCAASFDHNVEPFRRS
ncbi:hypothetical protein QUW41_01260 [Slackia piriformis]|nr:hypothetical protein [Slackia piriformis]